MKNLNSILKGQDITLPTKVHTVKAMVFPAVMYRCESWTIKKAEHWKMDASELWYWRRLLRVPLDCKEIKPINPKGNQLWIFIGRTVAEAEAPVLWSHVAKCWLIGKDTDAGKDWRRRRWQRMGWLDSVTNSMFMNLSKLWKDSGTQRSLMCCSPWGPKESDTT